MKYKLLIFVSLALCLHIVGFAQTGNYDEKIPVGNGLYKVKNHDRWGIVDDNGRLKLSVEYNEPLFMNGSAVITKYGTAQLAGVIDSTGNFTLFPPLYVNAFYPFVSDGMLAVRNMADGNWGFLDTRSGELLKVQIKGANNKNKILKKLGITGKGIKGTFIFEFVAPFVEGVAAVYSSKTGWHHIDRTGQERFKDSSMKPTFFRSSVHNGECVMFSDKGIVVCKETPDHYAGIVNYIENDYELKDYHEGLMYPYSVTTNGSGLILNSKFQADKYENRSTGDSVIFIERPKIVKPVVVEKKDSFNLERDITIGLAKDIVTANSRGSATITIKVENTGKFDSDTLELAIDTKGLSKDWNGVIAAGETQQVTLNIQAKFSASSIKRVVSWILKSSAQEITGDGSVTIRRYRPSRR